MVITTSFVKADEDSNNYLASVEQLLNSNGIDYYLIGDLALANEMQASFKNDLNLITILTVLVIFIVVAIAFKSLFIPLAGLIHSRFNLSNDVTTISDREQFVLSGNHRCSSNLNGCGD